LTIAVIAAGILTLEERSFGHPYIEALVLATLFGFGLRSGWQPIPRYEADIAFSAKGLLEGAVALLGATVSVGALLASGPAHIAGIVTAVILAIGTSLARCWTP
jgi:uncharacterized membrane protein YadS